jgi:hypothetical protein
MRYRCLTPLIGAVLLLGCSDDDAASPGLSGGEAGGGGGGGMRPDAGAVLPCPPGELLLDDQSCRAPGIAPDECGTDFSHDGDAGCTPILPATPCPPGSMAILGETSCAAPSPCGSGPWDGIPVDNITQHVDASYVGSSDGSASMPWSDIASAVAAAATGALVAIAPGSYSGLTLDKPVRLWGKCSAEVSITSSVGAAVSLTANALQSEIHNLALTGNGSGVALTGAMNVRLEGLWIHDTTSSGIDLTGGSAVIVSHSLVESTGAAGISVASSAIDLEQTELRDTGIGILAFPEPNAVPATDVRVLRSVITRAESAAIDASGCTLLIEESVVRDTRPDQTEKGGYAVLAKRDVDLDIPSEVSVVASVIQQSRSFAIASYEGPLTIDRSVIRDSLAEQASGFLGGGVLAMSQEAGLVPTVRMSRSLVDGTRVTSVHTEGCDVALTSTVLRNGLGEENGGLQGRGLSVFAGFSSLERGRLAVSGSRIEKMHEVGLVAFGADATIDSTHIVDIAPRLGDGVYGGGIAFLYNAFADARSNGTITRTVVERVYGGGVVVWGSDVSANDVIIREVSPQADGTLGDGFDVLILNPLFPTPQATSLSLERVSVLAMPRVGVGSFGARLSLGSSLLDCNLIHLDGERVMDTPAAFDNLGGNVCGCGDETELCRLLSRDLAPPRL